jgi:MFS family permease
MTTSQTSDRHRSFVAAMAIDSVAAGVFQPAITIYLLATTPLPLPLIGSALSIAGLLALPVGLWAGRVVDQLGPKPVLMIANVAQAVGVTGYLVLHSFWGVVVCAFIATAGRGVFFGTFGVALSAIAGPGERERWFGRIGGIRNLGQAAGGLGAGVALAVGTHAAYTALIVVTAASFLGAVPLMTGVRRPAPEPHAPALGDQSWATVLRDRPYWIVVAHWATFAFSGNVLGVAIPVYATVVLGLPGWVAGAAFTLNTLLIGFGQNPAVRRLDGRVRSRVMAASHVGYAAGYVVLLAATAARGDLAIGIVMLGVAVYTFGETIGWPVSSALAAEAAPAEVRGRYLALFQLAGSGVGAGAPVVLSTLLAVGAAATWLPLLGVCAAGAGLASLAGRHVPAAASRIGRPTTPRDEGPGLVLTTPTLQEDPCGPQL